MIRTRRLTPFWSSLVFLSALSSGASAQVLTDGGFEASDPLSNFPSAPNVWSGDNSLRTMAAQGISPASGSYMLQCVNSVQNGPGTTTACEIWQYIDTTPFAPLIATGQAEAMLNLRVNRISGTANTDTEFGGILVAYDGPVMWDTGSPTLGGTAFGSASLLSDSNVGTWENINLKIGLPVGTQFVLVRINASENITPSSTDPEFEGHYIDDVTLTIGCPIGTKYCSPAELNSTGMPGDLNASGSLTASDNNVLLVGSQLPEGEFAFFVASRTQGFFPNPNNSQGNLCVLGNIARFNAAGQLGQTANGEFQFQVPLNSIPEPPGLNTTVMAGETWNFQLWHRDLIPGQGPTSNFTSALEILFQ